MTCDTPQTKRFTALLFIALLWFLLCPATGGTLGGVQLSADTFVCALHVTGV
jgi:hypothetical protein